MDLLSKNGRLTFGWRDKFWSMRQQLAHFYIVNDYRGHHSNGIEIYDATVVTLHQTFLKTAERSKTKNH